MIIRTFLWALTAEVLGVLCLTGILYAYWTFMTRNDKSRDGNNITDLY